MACPGKLKYSPKCHFQCLICVIYSYVERLVHLFCVECTRALLTGEVINHTGRWASEWTTNVVDDIVGSSYGFTTRRWERFVNWLCCGLLVISCFRLPGGGERGGCLYAIMATPVKKFPIQIHQKGRSMKLESIGVFLPGELNSGRSDGIKMTLKCYYATTSTKHAQMKKPHMQSHWFLCIMVP